MTIVREDIEAWLARWAEAIRSRDFDAARGMFADDVVGFGTVTPVMLGLDALVAEQWQHVWPRTRDFSFDPPVLLEASGDVAVVAAEWRSEGGSGDRWYQRRGRATLVLRQTPDGLVCAHSHFSMFPGTRAFEPDQE